MGKNVIWYAGATEVPTVAENTEKLNGTMTPNPVNESTFFFQRLKTNSYISCH